MYGTSPTSALATRAFCFQILFRFSHSFNLAGSSPPSSVDPLESYDRWREPGATGSSVWVTLPIRWARLVSSCPSFLAFCFRTSPVALPFCDVLPTAIVSTSCHVVS
ncbi:hypothetical protein N5P37_000417 [Trichoderma harzianum]|nr:hypothetical protein N5P37_000417 [Trichoderma harzianum]